VFSGACLERFCFHIVAHCAFLLSIQNIPSLRLRRRNVAIILIHVLYFYYSIFRVLLWILTVDSCNASAFFLVGAVEMIIAMMMMIESNEIK